MSNPLTLVKLRKLIATISLTAIVASLLVVPTATQAQGEVPSWGQEAYDLLGDPTQEARPGAPMNKCEFSAMLVRAFDLELETGDHGFVDVPDWCAPYAYTLKVNNVIEGETPTVFGAGQDMPRVQAFQMVYNMLNLDPAPLPSTCEGEYAGIEWGEDATGALFEAGLLTGDGDTGKCRPAAAMNRIEGFVFAARSNGLIEPGEPVEPPVEDGALTITENTPFESTLTVPARSAGVLLATFDFTATDGDTVVDTLKISRGGVGDTNDWSSIYVFEGENRLRAGKSISSDDNTVEFNNLGIEVKEGETVAVSVRGDLTRNTTNSGNVAGGEEHYFAIASVDHVSATTTSITGLPVVGPTVSLSSTEVSVVTAENGPSLSKPTLGQSDALVGNFKVTAGANDVGVEKVTLVQNGTMTNTNLKNLTLKDSVNGEVLGSVSAMADDKAVIVLDETFNITKSQNRTFELYADITGGKSSDTVRFYLEESGDLVAVDQQYNFGAAVTNSFGSSTAYCLGAASNTCPSDGSLEAGSLTFAGNGPVAGDVPVNSTQTEFFNFSVTADRNVTVKDYDLIMEQTTTSAGSDLSTTINEADGTFTKGTAQDLTIVDSLDPDVAVGDVLKTASGVYLYVNTVTSQTAINVTPRTGGTWTNGEALTLVWDNSVSSGKIKNLKLVDADSGSVLYSTATPGGYTLASDDFDINTGETRKLSLRADIDSSAAATNAYKFGFDFTGSNYVKDNDANEFLSSNDIVGGNIFGKVQTLATNSLTLALSTPPSSTTHVKGSGEVGLVAVAYTAGDAGPIKLNKLVYRIGADDDATFDSTYGDVAANSVVSTASLYKGATKVAGPIGLSSVGTTGSGGYYKAEFSSLSETVAAGATEVYTLKVELKNTVSATRYIVGHQDDADVTAQDSDNNSVSATDPGDFNNCNQDTVANCTPTVYQTISTAGTLTMREEGSPDASILVANTNDNLVSKYKFTALNEAYTIQNLQVVVDSDSDFTDAPSGEDAAADSLASNGVVIKYTDANGDEQTARAQLNSGVASFANLTVNVPKDGSSYVTVHADLRTISDGADSGDTLKLGFDERTSTSTNTFSAVGQSSSETITAASSTLTMTAAGTSVDSHTVRETQPIVAKASGLSSSFINGQNSLYKVNVTADSQEAVSLKTLRFKMAYNRNSNSSGNLGSFKFYRGSTDITDDVSITALGDSSLANGQDLEATSTDGLPGTGDDSATSFDGYVVVTFNDSALSEEIITAGATKTYELRATASGVDNSADSVSVYIADDTNAVTNFAGIASHFDVTRLKVVTQSGDADALIYDVNGDTTASAGAVCTNSSDDILLGTVGGSGDDGTIASTVTDCDSIAAATTTLFKTLTDNGDADDSIVYDVDDDTAEGIDGAAYSNTADDIIITAAAAASSAGGALPADSDAAAPVALDLDLLALVVDAGSADSIAYVAGAATGDGLTPNNGSTCTGTNVLAGGAAAAADCEVVTFLGGPSANFVWSDNSNTSHTTRTSDWTNGYLVDTLTTDVHTLSF